MIKPTATAVLAAAVIALPGCAQEQDLASAANEGGDQCFPVSAVNSFREGPEENQIIVEAGVDEYYLFETFGPCPSLDFSWNLALETEAGSFICDAMDVDLIVPDPGLGTQRCPVQMIRPISEAEVEAL